MITAHSLISPDRSAYHQVFDGIVAYSLLWTHTIQRTGLTLPYNSAVWIPRLGLDAVSIYAMRSQQDYPATAMQHLVRLSGCDLAIDVEILRALRYNSVEFGVADVVHMLRASRVPSTVAIRCATTYSVGAWMKRGYRLLDVPPRDDALGKRIKDLSHKIYPNVSVATCAHFLASKARNEITQRLDTIETGSTSNPLRSMQLGSVDMYCAMHALSARQGEEKDVPMFESTEYAKASIDPNTVTMDWWSDLWTQ